jgi:hypothetical protein
MVGSPLVKALAIVALVATALAPALWADDSAIAIPSAARELKWTTPPEEPVEPASYVEQAQFAAPAPPSTWETAPMPGASPLEAAPPPMPGTVIAPAPVFAEPAPLLVPATPLIAVTQPRTPRWYARGEFLYWWMDGSYTPPLLTTDVVSTPFFDEGVLGNGTSTILFGNQKLNTDGQPGVRADVGFWLNPETRIEVDGFGLIGDTDTYTATSNSSGSPVLAALPIASPGLFSGSFNSTAKSYLLGMGIQGMRNMNFADLGFDRMYRNDFVFGFRYLRLDESLSVNSSTNSIPAGFSLQLSDQFETVNNFYGSTVGLMSEARMNRWCFTAIGTLGIGTTQQKVTIAGSGVRTTGGVTTSLDSGFLAVNGSNIGTYKSNQFTLVPQLELKLAYDFTPRLRATVGYDLIYWSSVVRPGDQIDTDINLTNFFPPYEGPPGPVFPGMTTDLFVQGVNVGGEFRF